MFFILSNHNRLQATQSEHCWGVSESAHAADFLGIPSIPGPFEMNPKDAVVIGVVRLSKPRWVAERFKENS